MDIVLIIIAFILVIVGIIGSIVPALPGPPIGWVGLLIATFTRFVDFSPLFLIITAIITLLLTYYDYILPSLVVRKKGGTKYGERGAFLGAIIGMFFGPWGVLIGPFVGAFLGEVIKSRGGINRSFSIAFSSFLGFILSIGFKLIWAMIMMILLIKGMF